MGVTVEPVIEPGSLSAVAQPRLVANELELRPWEFADRDVVSRAYAEPDIQHWTLRSMTAGEAEPWIRDRIARWRDESGVDWAIVRGGAVVGRIALWELDLTQGCAQVNYWVLPQARGHRVAGRALERVTRWASDAGLHRVELTHSVQNPVSCAVARSAGFPVEGTMAAKLLHGDGWHDVHLHARVL